MTNWIEGRFLSESKSKPALEGGPLDHDPSWENRSIWFFDDKPDLKGSLDIDKTAFVSNTGSNGIVIPHSEFLKSCMTCEGTTRVKCFWCEGKG